MTIRPASPDEHRYVHESTLKTLRPDGVSWLSWQRHRRHVVERWWFTVVADNDVIMGFIGGDADGVRILYVRKRFRGFGIGKALWGASNAVKLGGIGEWSDL